VSRLEARIVVSGANIPITGAAEAILHERGVLLVPDFVANAGGVICAAVEYAGGSERDALATIEETIRANTEAVLVRAREEIKTLTAENRILFTKLTQTENRLRVYEGDKETPPEMQLTRNGRVLAVDSQWDFVVLDIGENQNALVDGELLVNRNGKLVAKVRIQSVQKDRCIANIVPGWKLGEVMEGDQAIPAYPQS
jgi:hypothetical protein